MAKRLVGPCMCGASDCPRCHPEEFNWCNRHKRPYPVDADECPKCEAEVEAYIDNIYPMGWR